MRAAYATSLNPDDPLAGLVVGERPEPEPKPGWSTVQVKAVSLNHHDLWTLRGVGIKAELLPMVLGCDAAGIDTATGNEVVVHGVISSPGWLGDETLDPGRSLLSEKHQGSLAEYVIVPKANVVPKPAELSFAEAACRYDLGSGPLKLARGPIQFNHAPTVTTRQPQLAKISSKRLNIRSDVVASRLCRL